MKKKICCSVSLLLTLCLVTACFLSGCGTHNATGSVTIPSERTEPAETQLREVPETTAQTEPRSTEAGSGSSTPREPVPSGSKPYYIRVNCQTNTVNILKRDDSGQYTIAYMVMVCSSGLDSSPTPTGTYHMSGNRWQWLEMVGGVWGMYTTQFYGNYLFHSVPYLRWGDHGSLQPGEFDKLGQDASHGCIRLQVKDAKWIYDHMEEIEAVEIYNSPDPGPLGKPSAPKIGNSQYPGWDPSDGDPANPWHNASAPTEAAVPETGKVSGSVPGAADPLP